MSEPTQQDRERAKEIAEQIRKHSAENSYHGYKSWSTEEARLLARVLLALLAEREAKLTTLCGDCPPEDYPTNETRCTPCPRRGIKEARASGRRAGLLELAEHCDGMCADKAWHPLIRQGYQNAASHARAMAEKEG